VRGETNFDEVAEQISLSSLDYIKIVQPGWLLIRPGILDQVV
jgi:hypothetical protein